MSAATLGYRRRRDHIPDMRLWIVPLLLALASPAAAQVWTGYPHLTQADIHRHRLEQQRLRSAEQAAFARQQSLNSRLTMMQVEAGHQPAPYIPLVQTPTSSRLTAAPALAGAAARREAVSRGVGQIDAWLDRDPR